MKLSDYALRNHVVTLFALFLIVAGGLFAYFNMGKLADPTFTIKTALVVTPYPGASPAEVDQEVTRVMEEYVQAADEVKTIRSTSRAGVSMVYVDLHEYNKTDAIQQLWDILRRKVELAQADLPPGAGPSVVHDDYSDVYGIFLALTGDGYSNAQLQNYADFIKREVALVRDVKKIQLFGIRTESINVVIDRSRAADLGIAPGQMVQMLNAQNAVVSHGEIESGAYRIRIDSASDTFDSAEDIGELVIQGRGNEQIRLKDIAEIRRGYVQPPEPIMRFNGMPAIGIGISAADGANVVEMGEAVGERIDELMQDLPVGVHIDGVYYESKFVKDSIKKFMSNLLASVGVVILVLLVAMGFRSGMIIAGNLVLSILGTLIVMMIWGISLQRISIAAMILVMGIIVDNAIVVTEGSLVDLQRGRKRDDAVSDPARRTAWPLLGATVITCLAFAPIYLAPSNVGEFCASLFQVVSVALLISWVLAMTQTPVFSHYFLKLSPKAAETAPHSSRPYRFYRAVLIWTLKHRVTTLLLVLAMFALGIVGFGQVPKIFFADSDMKQFFIDYRRPEGVRQQAVSEDLKKVEAHLETLDEVRSYATTIGQGPPRFAVSITPEPRNDSFAQVIVNVYDYRTIDGLIRHLQDWFPEHLPQGTPHLWKYINGPNADYEVEARFTGPDPGKLRELAAEAKAVMRKDDLSRNVCDDWRERVLVADMDYSQQKGRLAGVERSELAYALQGVTDGATVDLYRENDERIPVRFRFTLPGVENLDSLPVWGSGQESVPLGQVTAGTDFRWEDPIIRRYDRRHVIRAQCDPVLGVTADTLLQRVRPKIESIDLPAGYNLEWEGIYEDSRESQEATRKYLPVMLVIMVFILVALFNAIRQPLIIILTIPLALIGITAGLLACNENFSFLSILGTYALIGMMIKNAVVLIDQIDVQIRGGKPPMAAVRDSSVDRMRPVAMTSLTTICGMAPLVTDPLFSSMAVTIMFGLAFATVLTLFVVPVLYSLFFRIKYAEGFL